MEHDLLNLLFELTGTDDKKTLMDRLVNGLNTLWPSGAFISGPAEETDGKASIDIVSRQATHGCITFSSLNLSEQDRVMIGNAMKLVAEMLENRTRPEPRVDAVSSGNEAALTTRLSRLVNITPGVFFECQVNPFVFLYVSSASSDVLGYASEEIVRAPHRVLERVTPEDRDAARKAIDDSTLESQPFFLFTLPYQHPVKGDTWISVKAARVTEPDGTVHMYGFTFDVTESKRAEQLLRSSEEHLRTIYENSEEIIHIIAWDGTFLSISPSWERYTGFPVSETVGKSFVPYVHPDDAPACLEVVRNVYETGKPQKIMEFRVKHASGKWIWFMNSGVAIKDPKGNPLYFMGVAMDITERKLAEEGLLKEYNFSRTAFDSLPGLFYLCGVDGRFIRWNKNISTLTGYSDDEISGMIAMDLLNESDKTAAQKAISDVFTDGHAHLEASILSKDGSATPHVFSGNRIIYEEKPCLLGTALDISDRKRLEEQLLQAQKMEAVGQLAGGVAHDFNNLLQAILGYLELVMLNMKSTDTAYASLLEVKRAGDRAATLTSQLLAFSRRQVLQLENLDTRQVVTDLLKMLNRLIGEHIELVYNPGIEPLNVKADRGQIDQVLMNLCVNARDAMPGGGRLIIETSRIIADETFVTGHAWSKPGAYICISVSDTGFGMDRETLQQIFEPFFTTKEKHKGTGLGLAMVYGIIRQHEGMVQVYSEVGHGSCFKIFLPASDHSASDEHAHTEQTPVEGGTETILLAEDEEMIRILAETVLTNAGYRVLTAADGQEAIDLYKVHKDEISLLFLDVVMPKMGGSAVYETARSLNPAIRCLFASGYSHEGLNRSYVLKEGLHLLQKPYTRIGMLRLVRQILDENPEEEDPLKDE